MPISANTTKAPHFVLVASAGMGHLNPMTRLAATLSSRGCDVSFVAAHPTVSLAESNSISQLLSSFPKIKSLNLPLVQPGPTATAADPFFLRFESIGRSADNLPPLLEHPDSVSAIVIDVSLSFGYVPVAKKLNVPCYMLFTTCASLFSLFAYFPTHQIADTCRPIGNIEIPGALTVPRSSVIPLLRDPNHLFTTLFLRNSRLLPEFDGVLINTFEALEPEVIAAIRKGHVAPNLPPVISVGPLLPLGGHRSTSLLAWLDRQPPRSVVYVSFGNRTAMTREQIGELGRGLEGSGYRFLWVVKTKVVDRDEGSGNGEVEEALGEGFLERVEGRGAVVNSWIEQTEVLAHPAVGGFVSHCGWNSVTEAAAAGMRMLGWPRIGDQRVNGEVVRRSGLGIWMEEWSWEAEEGVVSGEEIAEKVREMMEDEELGRSAARVGEAAKKAVGVGGTSDKGLEDFIGNFLKL